jgi:hypothetical protein
MDMQDNEIHAEMTTAKVNGSARYRVIGELRPEY